VRLGGHADPDEGFAEITHHRTHARPTPPPKAISTIHKAKGLECDSVIVMPCDAKTFPDALEARCLLYVALSRAKRGLQFVVSRSAPSPLLVI
jgi:DNA helicase-2/ATP-dependent DNA helicase PcrA